MSISAKNAKLKNTAKTVMEGKYYNTIMTIILLNMLTIVLNNFSFSLTRQIAATLKKLLGTMDITIPILVISYLVPLLFSVITQIFQIGISLFFLNIACGGLYNSFNLFYGFQQHFGKHFCIAGVMTLISTICMAPMDIGVSLFRQKALNEELTTILVVSQLVLFVIFIILSLMLSQVYFVILDFPDLGIVDTFKQSFRIMRGNYLRYFRLQLSFLPLMLLALPTFGIGMLWLLPYKSMSYTLFFLDIMKADRQ